MSVIRTRNYHNVSLVFCFTGFCRQPRILTYCMIPGVLPTILLTLVTIEQKELFSAVLLTKRTNILIDIYQTDPYLRC